MQGKSEALTILQENYGNVERALRGMQRDFLAVHPEGSAAAAAEPAAAGPVEAAEEPGLQSWLWACHLLRGSCSARPPAPPTCFQCQEPAGCELLARSAALCFIAPRQQGALLRLPLLSLSTASMLPLQLRAPTRYLWLAGAALPGALCSELRPAAEPAFAGSASLLKCSACEAALLK